MAIKGKKGKLSVRERKKLRIRKKVSGVDSRPRLAVFRSSKHFYAQVISDQSGKTLGSASTLEKEVISQVESIVQALTSKKDKKDAGKAEQAEQAAAPKKGKEKGGKENKPEENQQKAQPAPIAKSAKSIAAAMAVGKVLAERCLQKNIKQVVFDRSGYLFHGRIKAVADGARMGGLNF